MILARRPERQRDKGHQKHKARVYLCGDFGSRYSLVTARTPDHRTRTTFPVWTYPLLSLAAALPADAGADRRRRSDCCRAVASPANAPGWSAGCSPGLGHAVIKAQHGLIAASWNGELIGSSLSYSQRHVVCPGRLLKARHGRSRTNRLSNGANEQHERSPGDPYQRNGRSSGQKAVGPVLRVT